MTEEFARADRGAILRKEFVGPHMQSSVSQIRQRIRVCLPGPRTRGIRRTAQVAVETA